MLSKVMFQSLILKICVISNVLYLFKRLEQNSQVPVSLSLFIIFSVVVKQLSKVWKSIVCWCHTGIISPLPPPLGLYYRFTAESKPNVQWRRGVFQICDWSKLWKVWTLIFLDLNLLSTTKYQDFLAFFFFSLSWEP